MTAELQPTEIVIVRRRAPLEAEQVKNGVWKIAFADFMTAMMAFFLVMWLINVTDDSVRRGVAQYFNPVKLASTTQTRKGLNDPDMPGPEQGKPAEIDVIMNSPPDPDGTPGAANGREMTARTAGREASAARRGLGEFKATHSEAALFRDPYAVLDQLAEGVAGAPATGVAPESQGLGTQHQEGAQGGEAFRDPFDPMYWQFLPGRETAGQEGGETASVTGEVSAGAASYAAAAEAPEGTAAARPGGVEPAAVAAASAEAGQRVTSRTDAGIAAPAGTDQAVSGGHVAANAMEGSLPQPAHRPAAASAGEAKAAQLADSLAKVLEGAEGTSLGATAARVNVVQQGAGVLISLTDDQNYGMFAVGSAEPRGELVKLMERIGGVLASKPGRIIIRGHTDGRPFKSRDYDNWRLSTARAHMALYMLQRGGVDAGRIDRVEGYADRDLKLPSDPLAPVNRRIEIFILEGEA